MKGLLYSLSIYWFSSDVLYILFLNTTCLRQIQLLINKLMEGSLITEGCWLTLNVVELFLIGVPADWVVDLEQLGLEVKK